MVSAKLTVGCTTYPPDPFSAKSQSLSSYPTLRGRVSGAAAEEPPSESRRTILFRCYPQPSQEGAQTERGIGLREPAQAASGSELGAVEVGVEGEAGRAKGIDWNTRHLLGRRCRSLRPTPHPEMPCPLSPPPLCKNAPQPQPPGAASAPRASGGPAPGHHCSRIILRQPPARLCAMMARNMATSASSLIPSPRRMATVRPDLFS